MDENKTGSESSNPEGNGPTDVPEESPSSESGVALSEQVAQREPEGEQDDE